MAEIKCPHCGKQFTIDESDYSTIVSQIKDIEFNKELLEREKQLNIQKDLEIKALKLENDNKISAAEQSKQIELSKLHEQISNFALEKQLAVSEALKTQEQELAKQSQMIMVLQNKLESSQKEAVIEKQNLKENYEAKLKDKDEQILQYKDFKARLSTKMVGETLEQHCETSFNQIRATAFPNAFFEKDNDAKDGSKGDYIFRDYDKDGTELVSIMFEMKNEMDETASKHKNENFFKKLDEDRKTKKCEYAVLVSMLEMDSELYNTGIVDVSHKYPKMYVIRPQFFIPLISIIRNESTKSLDYKKDLALVRNQNIDVTNFEETLNSYKEKFFAKCENAGKNFNKAVDEINKTIDHLEKVRDALLLTGKNLALAEDKLEDITVKRLTKSNPTMTAKFDELKRVKKQ